MALSHSTTSQTSSEFDRKFLKMYGNGILRNEVLAWRLLGAAVWTLIGAGLASCVWQITATPSVLVSPSILQGALSLSAWWRMIKLGVAESLAFAAHAAVISTVEKPPVVASKLLGSPATPASLLVSKALGRAVSAAGLLGCAAYLAAHATSAQLFFLVDPRTGGTLSGARWQLILSACLSLVHSAHIVYWSHDVIVLPTIQRHRYFRLKRCLPSLAAHALLNSGRACGLALALDFAVGDDLLSLDLPQALAAWLAASLCSFCWLLGVAVLDVVMGERLRPEDYPNRDVLGAMLACLENKQGELMRDLALHDFSLLAFERGRGTWRRLDVFADESGDRWRPIAAFCIGEVDNLTLSLVAAMPQSQPKAEGAGGSVAGGLAAGKAGGAARAAKKWNALPLAAKGALSVSRPQLQALSTVRCRYQRVVLCVHTLTGLAVASYKEDKYGVLQLTRPGLGEVALCLLSALQATQHFSKLLTTLAPRHVSMGPWTLQGEAAGAFGSQSVDSAVLALQDVLSTSLYTLAGTFGEGLTRVVRECGSSPAFGSAGDAAALLQGVLKGQE